MTTGRTAMREDAEIEAIKVEEAELQKYMASEGVYSDDEWLRYVKERYATIENDFKKLSMNKREADAQNRQDVLDTLTKQFRWNYKGRVWCVKTLRALGVDVEDKYVS